MSLALAGQQCNRTYCELAEHIANILSVSAENRDTIADEVERFLREAMSSADTRVSALAAALSLELMHLVHFGGRLHQIASEFDDYWGKIRNRIVGDTRIRILEIPNVERSLALMCYWEGLKSLSEAIALFGVSFVLVSTRAAALGDVWFVSPGYRLVTSVLGLRRQNSQEERERLAGELESLAEVFLRAPTPWVTRGHLDDGPSGWLLGLEHAPEEPQGRPPALSPDAGFAMVCILAADLERYNGLRKATDEVVRFLRDDKRVPENVRMVLLGRVSSESRDESLRALDTAGFNTDQRHFLTRWINGELHLVETTVLSRRRRRSRPSTGNVR